MTENKLDRLLELEKDLSEWGVKEFEEYKSLKSEIQQAIDERSELKKKAEKWDNCLELGREKSPEEYLAIGAKCLERELQKDSIIRKLEQQIKQLQEQLEQYKIGQIITDSHKECARNCADFAEENQQLKEKLEKIKKLVKEWDISTPIFIQHDLEQILEKP